MKIAHTADPSMLKAGKFVAKTISCYRNKFAQNGVCGKCMFCQYIMFLVRYVSEVF